MKQFVSAMFMLMAGAVFADTVSVAALDAKIRGMMDENMTVGMSVVVVKGDKVVYQQAFGYRDKDTREPLDVNDIFRIASISKSFSGMSVMQLVEAGKMSLDDDVNGILGMDIRNPRYPDIPVTIKMLLSHTSGMSDGGGYHDLSYVDKTKTDINLIREKAWLTYPPGKGYKYCNRALNIIGLVIEKVSGERFDEYVLNHILKPIGADNAGFNLDTLDKSTFTKLYTYDKKRDRLVPGGGYKRINEQKVADGTYKIGTDGCYWSPTGGMKMSAPNLVKWMLTLKNGGVAPNGNRILSEKGCKTLLTPVTQADPGTQYCLTTRIETRFIEGKRLVGHTGSAHGLFSCMYFCPDEDWGFVCICSSGTREKINEIRKAYYQTINLLYDQCIKPSDAHGRKVLIRAPSLTYDAPFPGSDTGRIYYFVPKGLDLTKPAPLLVFMHGGNSKSPDTSPEKYLDPKTGTMMPTLYDAPFIVAAPSAPPVAKGATKRNSRWCQPDAVKYIEATIDAACRKFKIDRDRVFLGGHSMGGFGAYHLAQLMPDRLAGAWLSAGAWRQADFRSMLGTPIFIMHGKSDCSPEKKYIVGTNGRPRPHGWTGVSYARAADELMTRYGVEHVYAEHADGHAINSDGAKEATRRFMEWTKDKRRAPYARKTALVTPIGSWHPTAESVTKVRWLELLETTGGSISVDAIELSGPSVAQVPEDLEKQTYALAPRTVEKGARIVAENLGGNRFRVKTENVRRFAILLAPPMGDLSKPFTVQVNGKSRTVLAETLSGMGDYTARLVVDVAAPPASFAYYLPVENSEGRSFRYWADHPLDEVDTNAVHAVVVVHGVTGGMRDGTGHIRQLLRDAGRDTSKVYFVGPNIVVPRLRDPADRKKIAVSMTEEEKKKVVYWKTGTWQGGGDSPVAKGFSSYDALDRIFEKLNDKAIFPSMKTVLICGYSAGGQVVSRYVALSPIKPREGLQLSFAAGAPSTWFRYFDRDTRWIYGLKDRNRYAAKVTEEQIMANLSSRWCLCFCGTKDVLPKWLDVHPEANAQGSNRYERFKNFRDYVATFPQLKGHFRFVTLEGKPHGGTCYKNEPFFDLVFGKR